MDDSVEVALRPREWSLLVEWVTRPTEHTKHGNGGGMQRRREAWKARMDPAHHTVRLTTGQCGRALSDVAWIAQQISNRNAGGFQARLSDIFENALPAFTNLPIRAKKR